MLPASDLPGCGVFLVALASRETTSAPKVGRIAIDITQ